MNPEDKFKTKEQIIWCPGCGNFGILTALPRVLAKMNLNSDQVLAVYGIGCHGHLANYLNTNSVVGLHGRSLPLAMGAKIANQKLTVLAMVGDGDQLAEGTNHLVHAARKNPNITCLIHNNQLYSLTVGQASPTSEKGVKTRSTPAGNYSQPLNPLSLALVSGASFVARAFVGDVPHLVEVLVQAIRHKGFSLVDILQPCVTLNRLNTFSWYRERVYKLEETDYSPDNKVRAFEKTQEWGEKIPLGVFFQQTRPTLEENILPQKDLFYPNSL